MRVPAGSASPSLRPHPCLRPSFDSTTHSPPHPHARSRHCAAQRDGGGGGRRLGALHAERALCAAGAHHLALAHPGLARLAGEGAGAEAHALSAEASIHSACCLLLLEKMLRQGAPSCVRHFRPKPDTPHLPLTCPSTPRSCPCPTTAGPAWRAWRPRSSSCTSCCRWGRRAGCGGKKCRAVSSGGVAGQPPCLHVFLRAPDMPLPRPHPPPAPRSATACGSA